MPAAISAGLLMPSPVNSAGALLLLLRCVVVCVVHLHVLQVIPLILFFA